MRDTARGRGAAASRLFIPAGGIFPAEGPGAPRIDDTEGYRMLDISISENGAFSPKDRRDMVDFLLRTDEAQKWTTASTANNAYYTAGHRYESIPELEDRRCFRRDVLLAMKDCPPDSLACDKYTITIWKKTGDVSFADILKTVAYELRDYKGAGSFFSDTYMFALHAEERIRLTVYRLYHDDSIVRAPLTDPLMNLSEEELRERYLGEEPERVEAMEPEEGGELAI